VAGKGAEVIGIYCNSFFRKGNGIEVKLKKKLRRKLFIKDLILTMN
jgi:hypothetical protein